MYLETFFNMTNYLHNVHLKQYSVCDIMWFCSWFAILLSMDSRATTFIKYFIYSAAALDIYITRITLFITPTQFFYIIIKVRIFSTIHLISILPTIGHAGFRYHGEWNDQFIFSPVRHYRTINAWGRHQMEIFPRYWPFVRGIHLSPVNFPHKASDAELWCLICALNKRLSNQSWGWWFETPSRPLWRHCNGYLHCGDSTNLTRRPLRDLNELVDM